MTLKMQAFANVWDALEPDPVIRANLKLRSALMLEITKWFEASGYTQKDAANVLRTTQPRLNDVLKGKIDRCTIDRLVNYAGSGRATCFVHTGEGGLKYIH